MQMNDDTATMYTSNVKTKYSMTTAQKHCRYSPSAWLCTITKPVLAVVVVVSIVPVSCSEDSIYDYYDYLNAMNESCLSDYANVTLLPAVHCGAAYLFECWAPTPAGETYTAECSNDMQGLHSVSRKCREDGTWEEIAYEYVNYECSKHAVLNAKLMFSCSTVSLVACAFAFIILAFSRSLWCTRNYIHWHLITSFGVKYLILFISIGLHFIGSSGDGRVSKLVMPYFEMTNFFWMFVEGLYLHTIVALAFRFDVDKIKFYWYCVIGWVFPLFFGVIYIAVCLATKYEAIEVATQVLIVLPIAIVLVLNSIFLLNIVRILMAKLRESSADTQLRHYRRTARATLVLVILLGISYVFPIFVLNLIKGLPKIVLVVIVCLNTILGGLQGFLVSLIYVFMNSEVKAVLSRKWERWFGFTPCPQRSRDYRAANTTLSHCEDQTLVTTVQSSRDGHVIQRSPVMNNNRPNSTGCQTLGNGKVNTNSTSENSYEMLVTSGDTSPSPVNGAAKEEASPLLAGNVIINENGRTVVHDHEDNLKEQHRKGTDV